ncbi:MAG: arsenosugar biosynthesis radical SAM protein ArsS [Bacteroidetes bacterium]|nr:arsenosugar biosynthesis radical SAM protein ArsS [Bacteroidota bacterium]
MITLDTIPSGPRATSSLSYRVAPLACPEEQFKVLDAANVTGGPTNSGQFELDLASSGWPRLKPERLEIFQINLGKLCNMTCRHCHVDAGPDRTQENMNRETVDACLRAIDKSGAQIVDLTGGAPELNPNFEYLVDQCIERGLRVLDRCNLTILLTRRYEHLPEWFAERGVEVVCSLPHYRKMGTDAQRGDGTYQKSIDALHRLNQAGYGQGDHQRRLTLVTNPVGAFLSGNQASLESEWKIALKRNYDITFDQLLTLNNLPMSRYLEWLVETHQVEVYLNRLLQAFNPSTIAGLMCRNTLSVSWDGYLYDCDFNQQLEMRMNVPRPHVSEFDLTTWINHEVRTARHCYGCTAGAGSSCGGAIT